MSVDAAIKIQQQIRENNTELNDFLTDLTRWEESIKNDDKNLKTSRRIEEQLPPVRSKKVKKSKETGPIKDDKNNNGSAPPSTRIKSYDYDAWSKFNVEEACKDSSEECSTEDSQEEEDEDEMERIRESQQIQQANLEKEKGNQLFKEGKYEAAISRYTTAITLHSSNPILYANRGMALLKTGRYGAAEQDCSSALEYDPTYTKALARRATAREKLQKYQLAVKDYEQLLELEPKNKQALSELERLKKISSKTLAAVSVTPTHQEDSPSGYPVTPTHDPIKEEKKNGVRKSKSTKPLKRIPIVEIGVETDMTKNQEDSPSRSVAVNATHGVPCVPTATTVFNVPTSSVIFETEFNRLKNNQEVFYKYIQVIPLDSYGKLFYQCIDVLMSPYLSVLLNCYVRDSRCFHEELDALSKVKRFQMAKMFLTKNDKQTLRKLFDILKADTYPKELTTELLNGLENKYL